MAALLFFPACGSMTPEKRIADEIYWEAAKECESRHRTLHLDRIDSEGNVSVHADAESRIELPAFNTCYQRAVRARAEKRRQADLPVPDTLNLEPTADLD
jgi:hypothetical protein